MLFRKVSPYWRKCRDSKVVL